MNLDQLIKSCIKKNRKAQEELYNRYKEKLFPICLKYCRTQSEAKDHLHDVFIEIFDKINKYKGQGSFEGWMKRIAINKAIDKYKKRKTFSLNDQKAESLSDDTSIGPQDMPPTLETLMTLIQKLPDRYRLIFNLYELDGYTHPEISKKLGISVSTSKSNLHRAKAILKTNILQGLGGKTFKKERNGE